MERSIIYYTDNLLEDPIYSVVQMQLLDSGLPIYSASLEPIDFGINEVIQGERSYPTMLKQIISCLNRSPSKYVFFAEHDVLYPESHFDFTPPKDNIFYYNENCWRWEFGTAKAIRHDRMLSQSCLCVNREFALDHYQRRQKLIEEKGWGEIKSHEPSWARVMGYEPGQKKKKRGGFSDDDFETWSSAFPVIDIRHSGTFSRPKVSLKEFTHQPKWWKEIPINKIEGWDLKELYNL